MLSNGLHRIFPQNKMAAECLRGPVQILPRAIIIAVEARFDRPAQSAPSERHLAGGEYAFAGNGAAHRA